MIGVDVPAGMRPPKGLGGNGRRVGRNVGRWTRGRAVAYSRPLTRRGRMGLPATAAAAQWPYGALHPQRQAKELDHVRNT
jgi:hypothetical protein